MSIPSCTGVILAGGENKRFNGQEKAFIRINEKAIIGHILQAFNEFFDEIIVVTNSPIPYLQWKVHIVSDIYPMRSSLTGIHAGLFYTRTPYAFITACDTPFIQPSLINYILQTIQPKYDVIMPQTLAGIEPLCAVYSKQCLHPIQQQLTKGQLKIQAFFNKVRVKTLPEKLIRKIDPELISFFNINTPEDLKNASHLLQKQPTGESHDIKRNDSKD